MWQNEMNSLAPETDTFIPVLSVENAMQFTGRVERL